MEKQLPGQQHHQEEEVNQLLKLAKEQVRVKPAVVQSSDDAAVRKFSLVTLKPSNTPAYINFVTQTIFLEVVGNDFLFLFLFR